ncbi:DUF192 domain-containing protein [Neobacillus piezotolerans]|uniref:DUF192 domain-containing protein n=1 Tax=Neobacillus piezotolerans TaxID=2259171 RepID=A0A3D8GKL8_9BACI|nr:DUF192 domain-containing protein [Neobacillus piezotolerans]RDU34656.1 DUF192 domain-containing protein [Neobacillus piezotolerans]
MKNTVTMPFVIQTADTFYKRFKGLMFRNEPIREEGLWIVPCNSVHMFFMSFPIDIVLLNEQKEVIRLIHSLKPWRATKPDKNAFSVLELPVGTIGDLCIRIGDTLEF